MLAEAPYDYPELDKEQVLEQYRLARVEVIRLNEVLGDYMCRLAALDGGNSDKTKEDIGRVVMGSEILFDLLNKIYPEK